MLKYSVKFSIKNNSQDKATPVRMRVSFNSNRTEIYIGVSVKPSEWDIKNSKTNIKNDKRNSEIIKSETIINEIFEEFDVLKKKFPTVEELKIAYSEKTGKIKPKTEKEKVITFSKLIELYIEEKSVSKQWEQGTFNGYIKLRNHAHNFNPGLDINEITAETLRKMIDYFMNGPLNSKEKNGLKEKKSPHRNVTIRRNIDDYKRILAWGFNKGLYKGDAHKNFEQRFKGTQEKLSELVYLEWDELIDLLNKDFGTKNYLARVRDVFCFCCFTSLRFSDVRKLKKSDIRNDKILVTTKKTTDPLVINLNDFAKEILKKYSEVNILGNLALPVISMSKTNEYLKDIGEIMEFNAPVKEIYFIGNKMYEEVYLKKEVISTHAARRTFVINSLRLGIPSEVIIKWTGHKDFESLKPYVKIVDELKENEMAKFNSIPKTTPKNNDL